MIGLIVDGRLGAHACHLRVRETQAKPGVTPAHLGTPHTRCGFSRATGIPAHRRAGPIEPARPRDQAVLGQVQFDPAPDGELGVQFAYPLPGCERTPSVPPTSVDALAHPDEPEACRVLVGVEPATVVVNVDVYGSRRARPRRCRRGRRRRVLEHVGQSFLDQTIRRVLYGRRVSGRMTLGLEVEVDEELDLRCVRCAARRAPPTPRAPPSTPAGPARRDADR